MYSIYSDNPLIYFFSPSTNYKILNLLSTMCLLAFFTLSFNFEINKNLYENFMQVFDFGFKTF